MQALFQIVGVVLVRDEDAYLRVAHDAFKLKDEMNINMKFKDFAELYLSDIQPRIKYNSFLTKKHIIETKILPYFGRRKLNEIRPADVIQWQNEIMKLKSNKTFL